MKGVQYSFGDEFGDSADGPTKDRDGYYNPSRMFGYGISVPRDLEGYARIRVRLEELDRDGNKDGGRRRREIKTRRLPKARQTWIAKEISKRSGSFVYYVDKMGDVPEGWAEYTPAERMVALVCYSVCDVLDRIDAQVVDFVFDSHTALETPWAAAFLRSHLDRISLDTGRIVTLVARSSSRSEFAEPLQVADAISHFSLTSLERGRRHNAKKAGIVVTRLGCGDSILYDDLLYYSRTESDKVASRSRRDSFRGESGLEIELRMIRRMSQSG